MMQVFRRMLLAAGMLLAAWHFWFTPPQLIGVRVVDFKAEYESKYGDPKAPEVGFFGATRAFLRKHGNPGSAAKMREEAFASRSIQTGAAITPRFLGQLAAAARGEGSFAGQGRGPYIYFDADQEPVRAIAPALRRILGDTGFLNAYASAGNVDLEFYLHPDPHSSSAPNAVLYPLRAAAPLFAIAGLLLYAFLGLSPRTGIRHDPLPLTVLDIVASLSAGFFFGLPLWIYPSTQAALDDWFGGTWFFWGIAAIAMLSMLPLAAAATLRVECLPEGLRIRRFFSTRTLPWNQLAHVSEQGLDSLQPGIQFQLVTGERVFLPWTGLRDGLTVVKALRQQGWLRS